MYGYQVDLYAGTSTSGTNIVINGGSGYYTAAGDITAYFLRTAIPGGGSYSITTSHSYPLYIRVRAIFTIGAVEYQSAWSSLKVT